MNSGKRIFESKSSDNQTIIPSIESRVSSGLAQEMYDRALEITRSKIRGGESEPFFKKPFIDAAFSPSIFLWDTSFMCCFAKYHLEELPVYQALDNFYEQIEKDGYICREYRADGKPLWPKDHPVSINPPLLALAELEVFSISKDLDRINKVYPILKKNFQYLLGNYMMEDDLFYADTMGMGMDNIPRSPRGWEPAEGNGWTHEELGQNTFDAIDSYEVALEQYIYEYTRTKIGVWNKDGRFVDFSAQMAMLALQLKTMAELTGGNEDIKFYLDIHSRIKNALNKKCWNEDDAFYYDLGYGQQIKRRHIGMYWALLGQVVPDDKLQAFISHLTDPNEFYTKTPLCSISASDPEFSGTGDYWLGGVWAPTVYMVLKGLSTIGEESLAKHLAAKIYDNVAEVYQATGTFWENYAPDFIEQGTPSRPDFCGWTALIPIAIYNEYIKD